MKNQAYYSFFEINKRRDKITVYNNLKFREFANASKAKLYIENSVRLVDYIMKSALNVQYDLTTVIAKHKLHCKDQNLTRNYLTSLNKCQMKYYDVTMMFYTPVKRIHSMYDMLLELITLCIKLEKKRLIKLCNELMDSFYYVFDYNVLRPKE